MVPLRDSIGMTIMKRKGAGGPVSDRPQVGGDHDFVTAFDFDTSDPDTTPVRRDLVLSLGLGVRGSY